MKTKEIPAIIMLIAGFVDCIISLQDNLDLLTFCIRLLIVLLVFYFLGVIVRIVVEINFKNLLEEKKEDSNITEDQELENIDTTEDAEEQMGASEASMDEQEFSDIQE